MYAITPYRPIVPSTSVIAAAAIMGQRQRETRRRCADDGHSWFRR
jgi:hypothetical protein